jgi:hypothetical protein
VTTFVLGFFSGVLALLVLLLSRRAEPAAKSRRWTSIEQVQYRWQFDYSFEAPILLRELVAEMPSLMKRNIEKKPLPDDGTTVDPGAYSVELLVHFRFVGREDEPSAADPAPGGSRRS